jgi:hypothetical protein
MILFIVLREHGLCINIYGHLAKTNIDPLQDIENIVGIPYIVILLYGLAAAISGGFFFELIKNKSKIFLIF